MKISTGFGVAAVLAGLVLSASAAHAQSFRIENRYHPEQAVNVEKGLASSPAPAAFVSAMWVAEPVVGTAYIRLRNAWTSDYLALVNRAPQVGKFAAGAPGSYWEVEPVPATEYYRLRSKTGNFY